MPPHPHNARDCLAAGVAAVRPGRPFSDLGRAIEGRAGRLMQPGMVFTVEPMISAGTHRAHAWADGWTAVTADLGRSAQFEHTVLVTETGVEVLTA